MKSDVDLVRMVLLQYLPPLSPVLLQGQPVGGDGKVADRIQSIDDLDEPFIFKRLSTAERHRLDTVGDAVLSESNHFLRLPHHIPFPRAMVVAEGALLRAVIRKVYR